MIQIKINGIICSVPKGTTVLNAVRMNSFNIPTLCNKPFSTKNRCGICVVEVCLDEEIKLVNSCCTEVKVNMVISTLSKNVISERARRVNSIEKW